MIKNALILKWTALLILGLVLSGCMVSCGSKNRQKKVLAAKSQGMVRPAVDSLPKTTNTSKETPLVAPAAKVPVVAKSVVADTLVPIRTDLPMIKREFRAAWVATVANINWPSKNNLSTEEQKLEAISLLNFLQKNNFNAVIFQVRPSADALYESSLEPWSYFLTGETGKRPFPYYDPLSFWVEEAHKRGLEIHVWLNPYRAHHSSGGPVTNQSMAKRASEMTVRLKNGMYWFDPANQKTQDHASKVVLDIVRRYDIDGVHFDDYFYPYATYNGGADFPDQASWNQYRSAGGQLSRADWRRDNVNKFIKRVYAEIKATKKHVKFGLSPFGIWKPGYPSGISGSSQYDELYADAKLWLNEGWVDYFTPQLYWAIDPPKQSFPALLKWWQSENKHQRHLWPGLNTVEVRSADRPREIVRQVELTRQIVPNSQGVVHWSIAGLTKNPAMANALLAGPYREPAVVPASPWLQDKPLAPPTILLTKEKAGMFAKWQHREPERVAKWVVYAKYGDAWEMNYYDEKITSFEFPFVRNGKKLNTVAVKVLDRLSNESDYVAYAIAN